MTTETIAVIIVTAIFCCYLVYRWQEAVVGSAPEPYPVPVKCNQDCRQGRDCDCFQRSCDMSVEEFDGTKMNPTAAWPFPTSRRPE